MVIRAGRGWQSRAEDREPKRDGSASAKAIEARHVVVEHVLQSVDERLCAEPWPALSQGSDQGLRHGSDAVAMRDQKRAKRQSAGLETTWRTGTGRWSACCARRCRVDSSARQIANGPPSGPGRRACRVASPEEGRRSANPSRNRSSRNCSRPGVRSMRRPASHQAGRRADRVKLRHDVARRTALRFRSRRCRRRPAHSRRGRERPR